MKRDTLGPVAMIATGAVLAVVSAAAITGVLLPNPAPTPTSTASVTSSQPPVATTTAPPAAPPPSSSPASSVPAATPTDPATVPGAYQAAGHWWVPCDSPFAIHPQEFEYGCAIEGHEPAAGTLLAEPSPQPSAAAADVELGAQLLEAWIPYDSANPAAWSSAVASSAVADQLPQEPALAWSVRAAEFADAGFHAEVELAGHPQLIATTAEPDGMHLSYSVPITAVYSIERSCLPADAPGTATDGCVLVNLAQSFPWMVVIRDGAVVQVHEPDPFAAP